MLNPGVVYMAACSLLFAVAVVVHFHADHLSLPVSSVITILVVVLPIAAFLNAYIYPNLLRSSHSFAARSAASRLAPVILQSAQALVTAVLATLLLEAVVPSPALHFLLEYEWDKLYRAEDSNHLMYIQDTYNCCGLDSVDDRAYPFVHAPGGSCAEMHGRTTPCRRPWKIALQFFAGTDFAIVVIVALMQIFGLLIMKERTAWWTALRTEDWKPAETDDESNRLCTVPEESEASSDHVDSSAIGYGAIPQSEARPSTSTTSAPKAPASTDR
ncbi:uncharacterized protein UV8b_06190 [Ustilaginoidea virens]|uniref:Tetraspanin Tsp3 n=1 Tax=Ustilaginoidea virens TaxID=1159556 RepID=A0A8E5HUQ0_USTVR|nr:uncharacterized protein UV8b_06190 [Ustilaginoidea virens]QUC21949.1 hypothetical protein UV8b_06190 [Ustilaginoidea virens]